jgi:hypothetical protein
MEIATEDGVRKSIMFAESWKKYGRVAILHPQWVEDTPAKRLEAIDTKAGKRMLAILCDKVGMGKKRGWYQEYWSPSIAQWLPTDGCVKAAPFLSEWNLLNEMNKECPNSKGYRGYESSNEFRLGAEELTKIFELFVMQSLGDGLDWNARLGSRATQIQRTEDPTSWGLRKAADGVAQLKWLESKIGKMGELARRVEHEFLIKSCDIVKPKTSTKRNAL